MAKGTRYPAEFRAEAIRLYKTSSKPHLEVAAELGIAPESLRRWVIQAALHIGRLRRTARADPRNPR